MSAPILHFERAEFDSRLNKTRAAMESRGIELLIVTDPANMAWLSGYDRWSFYVPQCVAVPLAEPPLWFGREQDANGARRTVYFPPSRIAEYADDYIHNPPRHAMQKLCEVIQDFALPIKTIGVESDSFYFTAASRDALAQGLPESKFIDATTLVNWERIIKSPQELKYMRRAAKLAEAAHRRISDGLPLARRRTFCRSAFSGIDQTQRLPCRLPIRGAISSSAL